MAFGHQGIFTSLGLLFSSKKIPGLTGEMIGFPGVILHVVDTDTCASASDLHGPITRNGTISKLYGCF